MATIIRGSDNFDTSDNATQTELDNVDTSAHAIGVGQTWQDVTASRSSGVTYTNTTGKPIVVCFTNNYSNWGYVDGQYVAYLTVASSQPTSTFIVPNGSTYRIDGTFVSWNGTYGTLWVELR